MPTRLVNVGTDTIWPRVVETKGLDDAQYFCLSHCWGSQQIITTTVDTLEQRMAGIDPSQLSKTFLEAVELTRKLNCDYIWIDSLCILQDSVEDWEAESLNMGFLYSNSSLTIAATSASGGAGGLYRDTPYTHLSGVTPEGEEYELFFRKKVEHNLRHDRDLDAAFPLMSRGWIWQERLMSSRVIHFGPQEMFFECRSDAVCECGDIRGREIAAPVPKLFFENMFATDNVSLNRSYAQRCWRSVVSEYSSLNLTYESDRLPALSGMARYVTIFNGDKYFAGMFRNSLLDDLCWTAGINGKRPEKWRAPTWSWASVIHVIHYSDTLMWWDEDVKDDPAAITHLAKIVACETTIDSHDFGAINGSNLILEGILQEGLLLYDQGLVVGDAYTIREPQWIDTRYYLELDVGKFVEFEPDYRFETEGGYHVPKQSRLSWFILLESSARHEPNAMLKGIVLRRSLSIEGVYERIGYMSLPKDDVIGRWISQVNNLQRVEIA
jgi:hypothetical protein